MPRYTVSFHPNTVALEEWMMYHHKPYHRLLTWQRTFTLVNGHLIWNEDHGKSDERKPVISIFTAMPRLPSCSPSRPKHHRGAPIIKAAPVATATEHATCSSFCKVVWIIMDAVKRSHASGATSTVLEFVEMGKVASIEGSYMPFI